MNSIQFSIISPVYQAEKIVTVLCEQIIRTLETMQARFEIILVEDGSPDQSWEIIEQACKRDTRIRGLKLSRNFGQHAATTAGLAAAKGQYMVVLDCDLQDDPAYIPALFEKMKQGYDVVYTYIPKRQHPSLYNQCAKCFYLIFNWLARDSHANINKETNNFIMVSRKAADAFLRIKDVHRHNLLIFSWLGFSSAAVEIEHKARPVGKSSYTFRKLFNHAIDGIISQSNRLLSISIGVGFSACALSMFGVIYLVLSYIFQHHLRGWTSIMVLMLLCTGMILISLGILGLYLGKVFDQIKSRPIYLIDKQLN